MYSCGVYTVIQCQVAGFHALLLCVYCFTVPGCWVPCTAAVCIYCYTMPGCWVPCNAAECILLYRARLLGSMHCCCVYVVIPCQVAGFHALLIGEHCCTRLRGSVQCCCVLLSFSVCYCRVLCGVCRVWCFHAMVADTGLAGLYPLHPVLACRVHVTCIFLFSATAMSPEAGVP